MTLTQWLILAILLIAQNFSFTFVSRARNSGSLKRHLIASVFSNGIWFTSQMFIFRLLFDLITVKHGIFNAVLAGLFYTVFTIIGSLTAHYFSLRTEKGLGAVGSSKKYAQITVEEWEQFRKKCAI